MATTDIVIVGAGGFAREVYAWLKDGLPSDLRIKGFLSPNPKDLEGFDIEEPILGSEKEYVPTNSDRFVLAIGHMDVRVNVANFLKSRGAKFYTFAHNSAVVSPTASLGEGVVVCPFALVSPNAQVDDFALINFYASVAHDAHVGEFSVLSPYATLNGFAQLGSESFMGTHSTIVPGISVGRRVKIAAGTVALKSVADGNLLMGAKAKSFKIY